MQRRTLGATRERMLRELVDALEALARGAPLVLLLEDLHWSDFATLDLLGMLARRPDPARLLVLGTYRPADVAGAAHPLRAMQQELQVHGYCEELWLEFLSPSAVEEYVRRRCPGHGFAAELARSLDHPFSVVYACHFAAGFHVCRREPEAVQDLEAEALALSTEHGFRLFPVMGAIHRGWSAAHERRADEGIAEMRDGLAAMRAAGIELRRPAFLALVAEVCERSDRPEEGLAAVAEALTAAEQTGQHYWDAELYRLRGILTIRSAGRSGDADARSEHSRAAEPALLEAVAIARRQKARSLELRAAIGVSRLWIEIDRAAEARSLLSAVYGGFAEGFDTRDLVDARRLLDELARSG